MILFATNPGEGIQMIPASGGTPALITRVNREAGEDAHFYPRFLPGSREFIYLVVNSDPAKSGIALGSLADRSADSKSSQANPAPIVAQTGYSAHYDPATGRLLYIQGGGTLMAVVERLHLATRPPQVVGHARPMCEACDAGPLRRAQ